MAGKLPPLGPHHNLAYFQQQAAAGGGSPAGPAAAAAAAGTLQPRPVQSSPGQLQQIRDEALIQNDIAPPLRENEFGGVATDGSDQHLNPDYSPDCMNVQGPYLFGSLGPRRGMLMHDKSRDTINPGGGATPAYHAYYGHDLVEIQPFDPSEASLPGNVVLAVLGDSETFGAADNEAAWIIRSSPLWADHRSLDGVDCLGITLDVAVAGRLRVTAAHDEGLGRSDAEAIIIRYSTSGYPISPDGREDGTSSVAVASRTVFRGNSTNFDTTGLAAGTYYVTAWLCSREGMSVPVNAKGVVT